MLRYEQASIVFREVPLEVTLAINITGCPLRCPGCHSPQLWKNEGKPLTEESVDALIAANPGISCVAFMGGDADPAAVAALSDHVRWRHLLLTCWYSGKQLADDRKFIKHYDYIKVGPYVREKGPLDCETTNQRFYQIQVLNGRHVLNDMTPTFWKRKNP